MKKIIVGMIVASMMAASPAMADRGGGYRDNHERHHDGGGSVNPWPFIAGAVVGGIIISEVGRERERESRPPARYITVCQEIRLYDAKGRFVKTERSCHEELVTDY